MNLGLWTAFYLGGKSIPECTRLSLGLVDKGNRPCHIIVLELSILFNIYICNIIELLNCLKHYNYQAVYKSPDMPDEVSKNGLQFFLQFLKWYFSSRKA
jgi:hypothetical protein